MNAAVQMLIPPPKYMITDLVDCEIGDRIPIRHVFLIERGSPSLVAAVGHGDALVELLANTEDAYGFPPYAQLAPQLVFDGEGYDELRLREKAILATALQTAEVTRLRVNDFSWPEMIRARSDAVEVAPTGGQPMLERVSVASGPS
jgi:dolichol-phosphate mannosyltransferase